MHIRLLKAQLAQFARLNGGVFILHGRHTGVDDPYSKSDIDLYCIFPPETAAAARRAAETAVGSISDLQVEIHDRKTVSSQLLSFVAKSGVVIGEQRHLSRSSPVAIAS